jgi:hypothetical protein
MESSNRFSGSRFFVCAVVSFCLAFGFLLFALSRPVKAHAIIPAVAAIPALAELSTPEIIAAAGALTAACGGIALAGSSSSDWYDPSKPIDQWRDSQLDRAGDIINKWLDKSRQSQLEREANRGSDLTEDDIFKQTIEKYGNKNIQKMTDPNKGGKSPKDWGYNPLAVAIGAVATGTAMNTGFLDTVTESFLDTFTSSPDYVSNTYDNISSHGHFYRVADFPTLPVTTSDFASGMYPAIFCSNSYYVAYYLCDSTPWVDGGILSYNKNFDTLGVNYSDDSHVISATYSIKYKSNEHHSTNSLALDLARDDNSSNYFLTPFAVAMLGAGLSGTSSVVDGMLLPDAPSVADTGLESYRFDSSAAIQSLEQRIAQLESTTHPDTGIVTHTDVTYDVSQLLLPKTTEETLTRTDVAPAPTPDPSLDPDPSPSPSEDTLKYFSDPHNWLVFPLTIPLDLLDLLHFVSTTEETPVIKFKVVTPAFSNGGSYSNDALGLTVVTAAGDGGGGACVSDVSIDFGAFTLMRDVFRYVMMALWVLGLCWVSVRLTKNKDNSPVAGGN